MLTDRRTIRFAVPKGRLQKQTAECFARAGLPFEDYDEGSKSYRAKIGIDNVVVKLFKPQEIPILVSRGDLATLLHLQFNIGDLWIIGALVIWGLYSVLLRFRPAGMSSLMLVFFIAVCGVTFLTPFYIWETVSGQPVHLNMPTVWSVLYTGIFASVVAFITFNEAVARIGPSKAVYFLHLMPVFGALFSYAFLP